MYIYKAYFFRFLRTPLRATGVCGMDWKNIHIFKIVILVVLTGYIKKTAGDQCDDFTDISPCKNSSNVYICEGTYSCGPSEEQTNVSNKIQCSNTSFYVLETDESNCSLCEETTYGDNCTETAYCSKFCSYNRSHGCVSKNSNQECILNNVNISDETKPHYRTIGLDDDTMTMTVRVNLNSTEVKVTVRESKENETVVLNFTGDGYTYNYGVQLSESGLYEFFYEATPIWTASNGSTMELLSTKTTVSLTVYEPARITGVTSVESNYEEGYLLNNLVCSATGYGSLEISWYFGGLKIIDVKLEGRMYQTSGYADMNMSFAELVHRSEGLRVEDGGIYTCQAFSRNPDHEFSDIRMIQFKVGPMEPMYAERQDFLIAVSTLGAVLVIVIIGLIAYICKTYKSNEDISKASKHSPDKSVVISSPLTTHLEKQGTDKPEPENGVQKSLSTHRPNPNAYHHTGPNSSNNRSIPNLPGAKTHRPSEPLTRMQTVTSNRMPAQPTIRPSPARIPAATGRPAFDEYDEVIAMDPQPLSTMGPPHSLIGASVPAPRITTTSAPMLPQRNLPIDAGDVYIEPNTIYEDTY